MSTAIETELEKIYVNDALEEVRKEHAPYFDALQKHPRMLVGQEVPSVGSDGMDTLRDSEDAKEWQEAIKSLLSEEIKARAKVSREGSQSTVDTLHASVDLFKNNLDLVPGTKQFDMQLATRFTQMAKDYEVRVDGKLVGYSVPVQPLINNIRTQIAAEKPSIPEAPAPAVKLSPNKKAEPPQAGIRSKAGTSGSSASSDFSTLFGTLGLPDLVI